MLRFDAVSLPYAEVLENLHKLCFEKYWNKSAFEALLRLPTTYGWVCENGFILFSVCADEAEILTLGIHPQIRKNGVGTALLSYALEQLKNQGVQSVFLDVSVLNLPARALYQKLGFDQIAVRKAYYTENNQKTDALILKKKI